MNPLQVLCWAGAICNCEAKCSVGQNNQIKVNGVTN